MGEESMATQRELVDREVSSVQGRINSLNQFLSSHTPQPPPTQFETIELGHPVIIVYSNRQGKELEKKYVLTGNGEPEIYLGSGFMTLKASCPLGELLMGKRVGDVFDAFLAGHNCEVRVKEILQSLVPDKFDDESPAETSVTRPSIDGSAARRAA
jgi:transcription elongation GreA/GreB family factor